MIRLDSGILAIAPTSGRKGSQSHLCRIVLTRLFSRSQFHHCRIDLTRLFPRLDSQLEKSLLRPHPLDSCIFLPAQPISIIHHQTHTLFRLQSLWVDLLWEITKLGWVIVQSRAIHYRTILTTQELPTRSLELKGFRFNLKFFRLCLLVDSKNILLPLHSYKIMQITFFQPVHLRKVLLQRSLRNGLDPRLSLKFLHTRLFPHERRICAQCGQPQQGNPERFLQCNKCVNMYYCPDGRCWAERVCHNRSREQVQMAPQRIRATQRKLRPQPRWEEQSRPQAPLSKVQRDAGTAAPAGSRRDQNASVAGSPAQNSSLKRGGRSCTFWSVLATAVCVILIIIVIAVAAKH